MKIAIFYYIHFSGAKRVVQEHVRGLALLGNSVDIYTTDNTKDIFDPGIYADNKFHYDFNPKSINLPIIKRIKKDFYDIFFSLKSLHKKIANDIDKRNYDIVLVHTDINTQAPFLLKFLKTKNVYYCLEPLRNAYEFSLRLKEDVSFLNKFYENLNRWIRKKIDLKNVLSANRILTLSLFARERIIAAYDLYPKISYLGVNERVFKPKNIKKQKQVFFVAEKYPIYGYDLAIEALSLIPEKIRPKLKIVSWKKNNGERLTDEELVDLYNQSFVTLSLSRFDTFGLVPLESMACGVPVIALNVAGYRETMIDGKTGFLVDFSSKEIAQKIIYFLENTDIAAEMGKNGRKWIEEKWTWEKQIRKLNSFLEEFKAEK
nr:glycosyltransferase family 4 protein [Candidatus Levybacteria bacterium]